MAPVNIIEHVILCPDCDLAMENVPVDTGSKLVCPRCQATLRVPIKNTVEKTLALSLTGLLLFIPAIHLPLLSFNVIGLESSGDILGSTLAMLRSGFVFTGIAVFLASVIVVVVNVVGVIVPLVKLVLLSAVSLQVHSGSASRKTGLLLRYYRHLDEWGMLEVYMIGILVTIIKMMHMAKINYDIGFFCFIGLLSTTLLSSTFMDEEFFWEEIDRQARRHEFPRYEASLTKSREESFGA